MACRGVLFAILPETVVALEAAASDEEVLEIVEEIEEAWEEGFVAETDKAWEAIHLALIDDQVARLAILGGTHLHEADDYIVALVTADQVPEVARALAAIDDTAIGERYDRLVPKDYAPEYGAEDRTYTVANFRDVAQLYARAAAANRAVIFTVDQ